MEARVRLVAVDEDGTFLRDHLHYDRKRFARIFARMQQLGVRFVVATGNQCYQVQELFADYVDKMGIVSANGAYVLDGRSQVFAAKADDDTVAHMIDAVHNDPDVPFSMLGVRGAYVERGTSQEFFDDMAQYCYKQWWVDDFSQVEDQIFMFSSVVDESVVEQQMERYRRVVDGRMDVVFSGEGYFDVVCPGVSKALGLGHLLRRWNIAPEECVAFGDSDNDLEMLDMVGIGYAMGNASDRVRAAADRIAPPCDQDGVLQVLEELLGA